MPQLLDFVRPDASVPRLRGPDRSAVINELLESLVSSGAAPVDLHSELLEAARRREEQGSTGFGNGIAVPHIRHPQLHQISAAIGLTSDGIDFNALDQRPVQIVILLMSPQGDNESHINAMNALFMHLNRPDFRDALRRAGTAEEIRGILEAADTQPAA